MTGVQTCALPICIGGGVQPSNNELAALLTAQTTILAAGNALTNEIGRASCRERV